MLALGRPHMFAPADFPHQFEAAANVAAIEIPPVPVVAGRRDRAAKELGEQYLGQRLVNALRRAGQRVRHSHPQRSLFETDLRIGIRIPPDLYFDRGQGSAWFHPPEHARVNLFRRGGFRRLLQYALDLHFLQKVTWGVI